MLKGEKVDGVFGSGKTLNSGPNDNIFVYFADHGAKGLVAFGEATLKAKDLNKAILEMHAAKKYNKMVFYVEACESGSMFKVGSVHRWSMPRTNHQLPSLTAITGSSTKQCERVRHDGK